MEPTPGSPSTSPVTRSPLPRLNDARKGASFYDKLDPVVEELSGEGVVIELLRSGKHRLKSGTIDGILDWLLDVRFEGDARVQRAFLLCYRLFMQPKELWDKIDSQKRTPRNRILAVINFLLHWVEECSIDDFFSIEGKFAPPLWKSMQEFLKKLQIGKFSQFTKALIDKIQAVTVGVKEQEKVAKVDEEVQAVKSDVGADHSTGNLLWSLTTGMAGLYSYYMTQSGPRPPLVEGQFGLLDLLPEEICTCLTLSDFHQFRCIRLNEFLLRTWEKAKEKKTSKIADITQRFERVAYWVATEIVSVPDLYKRKAVLEHFVVTADKCQQCGNFNTAMAIMAGLNNSAITRLKLTWAEVPYVSKQLYYQLEAQFSPLQNFKAYRELLDRTKLVGKPGFPYLPLVLRDITYAHENPSFTSTGLLNFQKLEIMGKQIIDVKHWQTQTFQLAEVDETIQSYFRTLKITSSDVELYKASQITEPKEVAPKPPADEEP